MNSAAPASQTPKSAPSQTAPPPKPAPPPMPAKRGGFRAFLRRLALRFAVLAAVLGGGGYYAYQQPAVQPYMDKIIAFAAPAVRRMFGMQAPPQNTGAADAVENTAANAAPDAADSLAGAADDGSFSGGVSSNGNSSNAAGGADLRDIMRRLAAAEDEVARLRRAQDAAARRSALSPAGESGAAETELRLQIIDLRLRQSGDTAAAAAALSLLREAEGIDRVLLDREIARLQNAASKSQIAAAIAKLSRLSAAAPPDTESAVSGLLGVLRARRSGENGGAARLQRMELLWLTGRREAYLDALDDIAANPLSGADPNIPLLVENLQKYGAPKYALNYGAFK
ncbi:MAG: hypothetical protein ACR2P5_05490 [Gammaproteobacteria bacterium]